MSKITKAVAARVVTEVTVPAGDYWVGDPCYSVKDEDWMPWLEAAEYETPSRQHVLVAAIDGRLAVGVSTAFGDGVYPGSDGFAYPVDAGLLGLVPVEVAKDEYADRTDLRKRVTLTEPTRCRYDNGTVRLGALSIETGDRSG